MADTLQTLRINCEGGLNTNDNIPHQSPGEATELINFEPSSLDGGYTRVYGDEVTVIAAITGVASIATDCLGVAVLGSQLIVCADDSIGYGAISASKGGTTTPSSVITNSTRSGAGRYTFDKYDFTGTEVLIGCDGANPAFKWDGTTYTLLNGTGAPSAPICVAEFKRHVFFGEGNVLTSTAPNDDTNFSGLDGAVAIVVPDEIEALKPFKDILIIFCKNSILTLTGDNSQNFELNPLSDDIGCISRFTVQELGGDIIFLGPDGLRNIKATDQYGAVDISTVSRNIYKEINQLISLGANFSSVVLRSKSQYRLYTDQVYSAFPQYDSGEDVPTFKDNMGFGLIGVLHKHRGDNPIDTVDGSIGYEWGFLATNKYLSGWSDFVNGVERVFVGSATTGHVFELDVNNWTDKVSGTSIVAGVEIYWEYRSPDLSFDDGTIRKSIHKITIYTKRKDRVLSSGVWTNGKWSYLFDIFHDYNSDYITQPTQLSRSVVDADPDIQRFSVTGSGFTTAFKFTSTSDFATGVDEGDDYDRSFTIQALEIEYKHCGRF